MVGVVLSVLRRRHPTARVVLFRFNSSSVEFIGWHDNFTIMFVLGLAQGHVGRVARTNAFEVIFRVRFFYLVSGVQKLLPRPKRAMTHTWYMQILQNTSQ